MGKLVKSLYPAPDGFFTTTFSNRCKKWTFFIGHRDDDDHSWAHMVMYYLYIAITL